MNFTVMILGSDINAYYMARSYHEAFGKKVDMYGKDFLGVTQFSKIINFTKIPELGNPETFVNALNAYAQSSTYEKVLLIATSDSWVRLLVENKDKLSKKFVHNYPSLDLLDKLLVKENFYNTFGGVLDIPKTFIYSCTEHFGLGQFETAWEYPIVLKPSNGVEYHKHHFNGQAKVYKIKSFEELQKVVEQVESAGYIDNLIIQEFIPGGDEALCDVVMYANSHGKVELATFAQIGLQERTPTGVGNCTVLVNGFNEYKNEKETREVVEKLRSFLESIHYTGFAEFDLKYDSRDGKFKIFEVNPRQARSSYYLTACGHNLVQYLVDDLIYHKQKDFYFIQEKVVLSFVPKSVIRKYVESPKLLTEINSLIKQGKFTRPLHYPKDFSIKRFLYLLVKDWKYIQKYRTMKW
jgi:D-aspartate ligase